MRIKLDAIVAALFCVGVLGLTQQAMASAAALPASSASRSDAAPAGNRTGWWSQVPLDKLLSDLLTAPVLGLPLPPLGDALGPLSGPLVVPDNGFLLGSSAGGPLAIGALASDSKFASVTLPVMATLDKKVVVHACPATVEFEAVQGGSWSKRPAYDCSTGKIVGKLSEDGAALTFDLTALDVSAIVFITEGAAQRVVLGGPEVTAEPAEGPSGEPTDEPTTPTAPVIAQPPAGGVGVVPDIPVDPGSPAPAAAGPQLTPAVTEFPSFVPQAVFTPSTKRALISMLLVVACIVYWADGFGALPLRTRTRNRTLRIPFQKGELK